MALGTLFCGLVTQVIDFDKPCGAGSVEEGKKRSVNLVCLSILFDLAAMTTLITLGSLALKGRIHLPTKAGIGLLSGAGGVLLLPVLPFLIVCCQKSLCPRESSAQFKARGN